MHLNKIIHALIYDNYTEEIDREIEKYVNINMFRDYKVNVENNVSLIKMFVALRNDYKSTVKFKMGIIKSSDYLNDYMIESIYSIPDFNFPMIENRTDIDLFISYLEAYLKGHDTI